MIVPVIHALQNNPQIRIVTIALTTGGSIFKSENLSYKGYKDFIRPGDTEALGWGKKLAATHHVPESSIEEAESIAYLGLSYQDLVERHGEAEAARLWQEKGRHAFLQLSVFERIIAEIKPDMVVTTNSPRSEQAAVEVANARGIPTLSMVDLFGILHFHVMEARYIVVLSQGTIDNMLKEGVKLPRERFLVTGNPSFDRAFDYRGPVNLNWRREHLPGLPDNARTLLWIDMPAYWSLGTRELHVRSDEEILSDLDDMAAAAKAANSFLLIRPHPSQPRMLYDSWMAHTAHPHVKFAGHLPLYPLLNAIDVVATYTSTVSVEALLMQRKLIQLKYQPGKSDMPLGEWGLAWLTNCREDLSRTVKEAFEDEHAWKRMQAQIKTLLPQVQAGPKVASHIERILLP
jgi:hypothetical protein